MYPDCWVESVIMNDGESIDMLFLRGAKSRIFS